MLQGPLVRRGHPARGFRIRSSFVSEVGEGGAQSGRWGAGWSGTQVRASDQIDQPSSSSSRQVSPAYVFELVS